MIIPGLALTSESIQCFNTVSLGCRQEEHLACSNLDQLSLKGSGRLADREVFQNFYYLFLCKKLIKYELYTSLERDAV